MAKHKVEISNLNTSYIKVLTNDEMIELFKKYKNGERIWNSFPFSALRFPFVMRQYLRTKRSPR